MNLSIITSFIFTAIRVATPLIYGALAVCITKQAGLLNMATESMMLSGALCGVLASGYTQSLVLGVLGGMVGGILIGLLISYAAFVCKTDLWMTCIAVNTALVGGTILVMYMITGQKTNTLGYIPSLVMPAVEIPLIKDIPVIGPILSGHNLFTYLSLVLLAAEWFLLYRTKIGLRIRAVGQDPQPAMVRARYDGRPRTHCDVRCDDCRRQPRNGFPRCHHIRLLGCNGKLPSAHHHPGGVLLHVPVHHDDHHSGRSHAGQAEKSEGSQKETGSGSPAAGRGGMSMPESTPLNKQDYNNSMRLESYDLAKFAAQLYELNGKIIWDALCDSDYKNAKRVIAAGCGDSYCAAWAAQEAFRTLTGVNMHGTSAIEVSRCYDSRDFEGTLFFGISSRGRTSRVIEAAMRVNALGKNSKTVAIVNFKVKDSQLEKECTDSIHVGMPPFDCGEYTEHAPCQRSYFSTMFTMMLLAVRMGEARGAYSHEQAEAYIREMIAYPGRFTKELLDPMDDRMWALACKLSSYTQYEVVGTPTDAPNVWFMAAKVVEAFGGIATYENAENWLALNHKAKQVVQVLIADKDDPELPVALEAAKEMAASCRPTIVITDAEETLFPAGAEVFVIPTSELHWVKPLMRYCPIGLLLGYVAKLRGASFYRYGGENGNYIHNLCERLGDSIAEQPLRLVK